jgi:hypothetical protein
MATKKIKMESLSDRLDKLIDDISDLASEVSDGDLSPNRTYDRLDKICQEIEKFRDFL